MSVSPFLYLPTPSCQVEIDILIFACESRYFGVRAASVEEVLQAVAVAATPAAPRAVLGVMNLRGRVVPVLSTRQLLGLESADASSDAAIGHSDHFVVVRHERLWFALHVERAIELTRVQTDPDDQPSSVAPQRFVDLVVKSRHGLVQVIQPFQILSTEEVEQLTAIVSTMNATELSL